MNNQLTVILPAFNLEDVIRETILDSLAFLKSQGPFQPYELIVVDDGSRDGTSEILTKLSGQYPQIKIVTHEENQGYGMAVISGLRQARFPWILLMDADGQFKMESLRDMISLLPHYDIITGYRCPRRDPWPRVFLGKAYTALMDGLFGLKFKDINCGFKLINKKAIDTESLSRLPGVLYANLFVRSAIRNFSIKEIPVKHYPRKKGRQTGASLKVICRTAVHLIRLYYSLPKEFHLKFRNGGKSEGALEAVRDENS